jgi:hypothetical protein
LLTEDKRCASSPFTAMPRAASSVAADAISGQGERAGRGASYLLAKGTARPTKHFDFMATKLVSPDLGTVGAPD